MKEWNIGADASGRLADKPTGVETTNEVGSRLCKDPGRGFQAEGSASVKTLEALTAQGGQWGWSCLSLGRVGGDRVGRKRVEASRAGKD